MKILIAIHGSFSQPEHNLAQRQTWLCDLNPNFADYRHFVGDPTLFEWRDTGSLVVINWQDGPIWEGHRRTWHLNRKTEALARYAFDGGYDFVFKCDDDTYVYPERLLASGFEAHDYSGNMGWHWAKDVGRYQWAQGGSGYWLSRRAMQIIIDEDLTRVRAEDFAAGQLLAAHSITAHHDKRYIPAATEAQLRDPGPEAITLHKVSPDWMRAIHKTKGEQQCP